MSKVVPVWFMFDGEAIYFATLPDSHKVKRIKKRQPALRLGRVRPTVRTSSVRPSS